MSLKSSTTAAKGINVHDFNARHSIEFGARDRFYAAIDIGQLRHLARDWTAAPEYVKELYRSLEARNYTPDPTLAPTRYWWSTLRAIVRRVLWSSHQVQL